jgi:hypothetical protein
MLEQLAEHDLLKGKTIGFDAMTLEANAAAMKEWLSCTFSGSLRDLRRPA